MFTFILLGLGCRAQELSAPSQPATHPPAQRLRVATSGDYQPFSDWTSTAAEPSGFSADVARAFADDRGAEIEWVRFGWPDLLEDLAAGRFDLALSGITVRPERSTAGLFSLPLTTSGALVLVARGHSALDARALDRPAIRLAVNAGGHLERVARRLFGRARIEPVPRNQDVLARLLAGSVDGVVTDSLEAPHWEARSDVPLRRIGPLTTDRKAALFAPGQPELARRFDAWLLDAEASGQLAALRALHGLPPERTAEPVAALLASLDERLTLMAAVARAKATLDLPVEDLRVEARVLDAASRSVEREAHVLSRPQPDDAAVRRLFRAQIEAAKWIQRRELARPAAAPAEDPVRARQRLDRELRPALIRIGDRIAMLVARLEATPSVADLEFARTREALSGHQLPESVLRALHEALVSLIPIATGRASALPPRPAARDTAPSA